FRPAIWRLVGAIIAFNHRAKKSLAQGVQDTMTLGEYIKELPSYVAEQYLFPMASAIWSVPQEKVREFPIKAFLHFFSNHGLLDIVHKIQWNTIAGGSGEYIKKFQQTFSGTIKT
ncbi:hypothetical protein RZS08_35595, partial [Arthrospira platensis SPKY1]|nr:hypothetical protein [Arthrospira platensis SPKY1]